MLTIVAGLLLATGAQENRYAGETWTCRFPKTGVVIIDTREPGTTVTIRGKKQAAIGGSYFYYPRDRPDEMLMFGPNMTFWDYEHGNVSERATKCTKRRNPR